MQSECAKVTVVNIIVIDALHSDECNGEGNRKSVP